MKIQAAFIYVLILGSVSGVQGQSIGAAGSFNTFILNNFQSTGSDTEGAVAVGGNMNVSSYAINALNVDGSNGTALYVGGNLTASSGSINNGLYYVGGSSSLTNVGLVNANASASPSFNFASAAANVLTFSNSLSNLTSTGTSMFMWGGTGMYLTGDGTANPQVFNLTAAQISTLTYFNISNMSPGQTLIINVGPGNASMNSGNWDLSGYNSIINFNTANTITYNGAGYKGTFLAPNSTVNAASGLITGNVIAGNWSGQTQINTGGYWKDTPIPGYVVPEPSGISLAAFAATAGIMRRRKK